MTSESEYGSSGMPSSGGISEKIFLHRLFQQLERLRVSPSVEVRFPGDVTDGNPDLHRHPYYEVRGVLDESDGGFRKLEVIRPGVLHYSLPITLYHTALMATLRTDDFGCSFCGQAVAQSRVGEPLVELLWRQLDYHAKAGEEFPELNTDFSRLTLAVFSRLLAVSEWLEASPANPEFIFQAAVSFIIRNHGRAGLSVREVSAHVGVSDNYLLRLFNRRMKCSVRSFLITTRLNRACELLETGKYPIGEIAQRTGWKSHTYFSQAFHRQFGMSPAKFAAGICSGGIHPRPYLQQANDFSMRGAAPQLTS